MEPIFPITALQKNPAEVKAAAEKDLVRITEDGLGAFVFASEEVYERKIREAVEEARYLARISAAIGRGIADIEAGRFTTSVDEAFDRATQLRADNA